MGRVIFLLEEPSMKAFLLEYLPRLIPGWTHEQDFLLVPHSGKSDLDRSIPNKLKKWREPGVQFVIVRDHDGANCLASKAHLIALCKGTGRSALVRLVCQELESWYLGDALALAAAYPQRRNEAARLSKRFPDPDSCLKPSLELSRALPEFQKHDGARRLGRLLCHTKNTSTSFRVFAQGVEQIVAETNKP